MFVRLLLLTLTASYLYVDVSAQVLCINPLVIGELRSMKSRLCVDIPGADGEGSLHTGECDGYADQQIILCGDGTIRNQKRNYCFTPQGSGNGDVRSSSCQFYPRIPNSQKWRLGRTKRFRDVGGMQQTAREIINVGSGKCLDIANGGGSGNIGVYTCDNLDDQYFYFRSRGRQVARGRLRNERSSQCLDVDGSDGKGNVQMYNCQDSMDQWFRYYENGELVNEKSRQCLDVDGVHGSGNIAVNPCEDKADQMWNRPRSLCNGEYCAFMNKKSSKCLDVDGNDGRGGVATHNCDGQADQRLKFVTDKWTAPISKWVLVGCNQNGQVSQQISNTVEYSTEITASITIEVSSTIEANLKFGTAATTTTVSTSLSNAWTSSQSGTSSITFTCDNYDNQEAFTRGCMWQLEKYKYQ
eukprot:gene2810-biopygen2321